jgi:hypothetical protein
LRSELAMTFTVFSLKGDLVAFFGANHTDLAARFQSFDKFRQSEPKATFADF